MIWAPKVPFSVPPRGPQVLKMRTLLETVLLALSDIGLLHRSMQFTLSCTQQTVTLQRSTKNRKRLAHPSGSQRLSSESRTLSDNKSSIVCSKDNSKIQYSKKQINPDTAIFFVMSFGTLRTTAHIKSVDNVRLQRLLTFNTRL